MPEFRLAPSRCDKCFRNNISKEFIDMVKKE
jgi:hypothetical protein